MTYDRLDIIPLKLYLEISNTGNISLLSNDKERFHELNSLWSKLELEYENLGLSSHTKELLKRTIRISALETKYKSLVLTTDSLKFERDIDLMSELNSLGFTINKKTYFDDIKRIERESKSILTRIKRLEQGLPKIHNNDKPITIDKIILGYCRITNLHFNTNKITVTQFHSLKELAEEEIKNVEKIKSKKNG